MVIKPLIFCARMSKCDDTWLHFLLQDCFAYIFLFHAFRGANWNLRVASLKLMAPLFVAYDRPHYQKLIPQHLADIKLYPKNILEHFQAGGFVVSVQGHQWHYVALDEAHEMCINKDLKGAVVRPTKAYLQKTSPFFHTAFKHKFKGLSKPAFSRDEHSACPFP